MSIDWLSEVENEFDHPAIVLWRAIELKHIEGVLNKYNLTEPILDLGCAEGKIADILFKNKSLIGLDNCWKLLRHNNKDVYGALILGDGFRLPFKTAVFPSVFSNCVIEHIPDLDSLLKEVHRVIKDRGIFLFTVPSHKFADFLFFSIIFENLGFREAATWYKKKRNELLNHFHCYSHNVWQEKLKSKNFALQEYIYYMPKKAVMLWDFLAASIFFINKIKPFAFIEKKITSKIKFILKRYYNLESSLGGGLLIVAIKK